MPLYRPLCWSVQVLISNFYVFFNYMSNVYNNHLNNYIIIGLKGKIVNQSLFFTFYMKCLHYFFPYFIFFLISFYILIF